MSGTDWKQAYGEQQADFARQIGCNAHPNDISAAIRDLKRRAAGGDRKRARRRERFRVALVAALESEGVTKTEMRRIRRRIDELTADLVRTDV